jgi:large subunit ribosomal protein L22
MGKPKRERSLSDNEAIAVNRLIRSSPQKLNLVAQLIRGKKVDRALADLSFTQKRVAGQVRRTLESAISNAENNHRLDVDSLVVAEAHVGKRIVMKRLHARGRGRAGRIEKHFSQITIVVKEKDFEAEAARKQSKGRKGSGATAAQAEAGE